MHLNYNGVDLQLEHTADVSITPVMDSSGLDLLYQRITISMICVWNPWATASFAGATLVNTGTNNTNAAPKTGRVGDRLGVSLANLRQVLLTPQQPLRVYLGDDRVWDVPYRFVAGSEQAGTGAGTAQTMNGIGLPAAGIETQFACDPGGGPFPEECRILEIVGDRTAIIQYRITFHVTDCNTYVLSNRWRTTSHTGQDWLTTRITEGRAVLRLDKLLAFGYTADQFRSNFALGVPNGFIRKEVNVVATEDGRELYYRVVDKQLALNIPSGSSALKVEGHISTGGTWPLRTTMDALKAAGDAIANTAKSAWNLVTLDVKGAMQAALAACEAMPVPRAVAVVRVWGPPGTDRANLASFAVNVVTDRLANSKLVGLKFFPISAFLTSNVSTDEAPMVEVQIEALVSSLQVLASIWDPKTRLADLQKTDNNIQDNGGQGKTILTSNITTVNPAFPQDSGTRGAWISMMVAQILNSPCGLPNPVPPSDQPQPTSLEMA